MQTIYCRWAKSLGELEDTAENVWRTIPYDPRKHINEPCVFFGLYGVPDFYSLWRHKGEKWILWAVSDIRHLENGYWLDEKGEIRLRSKALVMWINKYCESWVENEVEYRVLKERGIESRICPSFLGDVTKFEVSYQWSEKPKLYTSVSGDNFELYGWDKIQKLSFENPDIEFHLYGNTCIPPYFNGLEKNVFIYGRIPKEQMNNEIKSMQGALRLTKFDGFSEILAKSILMGQWPVSLIEYPHMLKLSEIGLLKDKKEPNIEGRDYYLQTLNKFPWNVKKHETTRKLLEE